MNTKLITKVQREIMLKNGQERREAQQKGDCLDLEPVVKLFTPDAQCTWLLVALYPNDTNVAFGLCDLGMGIPEIGDVRISDIEKMRGQLNLPVERDQGFLAEKTLTEYSKDAREARHITT
jgi:DUF2958 family protein